MLTTDSSLVTAVRYADPALSWQELGYNHVSPIWGQNAKNPHLRWTSPTLDTPTTIWDTVPKPNADPNIGNDLKSIIGDLIGMTIFGGGGLGVGFFLASVVRRLKRRGGS